MCWNCPSTKGDFTFQGSRHFCSVKCFEEWRVDCIKFHEGKVFEHTQKAKSHQEDVELLKNPGNNFRRVVLENSNN
jgi:hypothetical protein